MSTSYEVAVLQGSESILPSERDIRLEDYLNDKFQTPSDFAGIDDLISHVNRQASQLVDQLQDANVKLAEAKKASQVHTAEILKQTADFQAQQSSITQRSLAVTNSSTTDDAIRRLEGPTEKLRRLELASAYVELLVEVDRLCKEAREYLPGDADAALRPYMRLKGFADNLVKLQPAADDAAAHIVAHVRFRQEQLYKQMKDILESHFKEVLGKHKAPEKETWTELSHVSNVEFRNAFKDLLDLQAPELACNEVLVLLPMKVLTDHHVQRFWFHFIRKETETAMDTKPKYFLEWVVNNIEEHRVPLARIVGPVLADHFRNANLSLSLLSVYMDPVAAWITALLPIVREKSISYLNRGIADSSAIHDMITELIAFDTTLIQRFGYTGGDTSKRWKGVAGDVLQDWFDTWLSTEKEFAVGRYQALIDEPKNFAIDYDYYGSKKTKPTRGAVFITDLLTNITSNYRRAPRTQYKFRFIIEIQIGILLEYDELLRGSLEAYKTNTTAVGGLLNAVSKEQQQALEGLGGIESLCKVLGSAEFIIGTLTDWANTPFFIDLFQELRQRAISKANPTRSNLVGPLEYAHVKSRTSAILDADVGTGSLFDVTIELYKLRKEEAERLIREAIIYAIPKVFRLYTTRPQWTTIDESNPGQVPISALPNITAELVEPLKWLESYMSFLAKAVSIVVFRRIFSPTLKSLQDILWNDILLRSNFTNLGAAQFHRDLTAIWQLTERYIPNASVTLLGMPKMREAMVFLNLPIKESMDKDEKGVVALDDVNDRLFVSNDEAKAVVEELSLGFDLLTHQDARAIVQRRVEYVP